MNLIKIHYKVTVYLSQKHNGKVNFITRLGHGKISWNSMSGQNEHGYLVTRIRL